MIATPIFLTTSLTDAMHHFVYLFPQSRDFRHPFRFVVAFALRWTLALTMAQATTAVMAQTSTATDKTTDGAPAAAAPAMPDSTRIDPLQQRRREHWDAKKATPPATDADLALQKMVVERAAGRWKALEAKRWEEAWSYLSPGSRLLRTPEQIKANMQDVSYRFSKVDGAECRSGVCVVTIMLMTRVTLPRLGEREMPLFRSERWEADRDTVAYVEAGS